MIKRKMIDSAKIIKGQKLKVNIGGLNDRLPKEIMDLIKEDPVGTWLGGYKMVDGNNFGIVLKLKNGIESWFFEDELFYIEND